MTHPATPGTPVPSNSASSHTLPGKVPAGGPAHGRGTHGRGAHGGAKVRVPADLLTVAPDRIRRALWRSFLRCGFPGELDDAVHAAMNVITPVLAARDAEITRLREALGRAAMPARGRVPAQGTVPARPIAPARARTAAGRATAGGTAAGRATAGRNTAGGTTARSRGTPPEGTVAVSRRLAVRRDPILGAEQAS